MENKKIIKALECFTHLDCRECPYIEENCQDVNQINAKDVLDLINRLNSENEILKELNQQVRKEKNKLMEAQLFLAQQCDKLQEENDRQQKDMGDMCQVLVRAYQENSFLEASRKCIRNETIKEFTNKVKDLSKGCSYLEYEADLFCEYIDNIAKEMRDYIKCS